MVRARQVPINPISRQPQQKVIDLSGAGGLAPNFFGNRNKTGIDYNLNYTAPDGTFVTGLFNPFKRSGYLSPANQTYKRITPSGTINSFSSQPRAFLEFAVSDPTVTYMIDRTSLFVGSDDSFTTLAAPTRVFTVTSATPAIFTNVAHGLVAGQRIVLSTTGTLYTGLAVGTPYYVLAGGLGADVFQVSLTAGGTAVNTSGSQSGVHSFAVEPGGIQDSTFLLDLASYYLDGGLAYPMFLGEVSNFGNAKLYYYKSTTGNTNVLASSIVVDDCAKLVMADNGFMYVLAYDHVDKFDGTAGGGTLGRYTSNVLLFPGNIITRGGVDYRGNLYIGIVGFGKFPTSAVSYRQTKITKSVAQRFVGVYIWDRLSTVVKFRDFVLLPGMQDVVGFHISPSGALRVFAISTNRDVFLMEYNGTKFQQVRQLPPDAAPQQERGVDVGENITYWLGADGYLYAYGITDFTLDVFKRDTEVLCRLLDVNAVAADIQGGTSTVATAGAIKVSGFYNTGQVDTTERTDHESILIGFQRTGGIAQTCTITLASPATITATAHGLVERDPVVFSTTGTLPTGIVAGTTYYVHSTGLTADTFQLVNIVGGSFINTSGSQSGVQSVSRVYTNEVIRYFPHTNQVLESITPKANAGGVYSKVVLLPALATAHHLQIYCLPGATTGVTTVGTIKLYANQSTTPFVSKTITRKDITKGYISIDMNKPFMNALQIEIDFDTAQALGVNDFAPTMAILTYTPTPVSPK